MSQTQKIVKSKLYQPDFQFIISESYNNSKLQIIYYEDLDRYEFQIF